MRHRMISVGVDCTTQPRYRLLVTAEKELGSARGVHPNMSEPIARTEAERFVDMSFGFLGTTEKILCDPDIRMSKHQISS